MSLATLSPIEPDTIRNDIGISSTLVNPIIIKYGQSEVKVTRELIDSFYRYCSILLYSIYVPDMIELFQQNGGRLYKLSNSRLYYAWISFLRFDKMRQDYIERVKTFANQGIRVLDDSVQNERQQTNTNRKYEFYQLILLMIDEKLRVEKREDIIFLVDPERELNMKLEMEDSLDFWVALNYFVYFSQILKHAFIEFLKKRNAMFILEQNIFDRKFAIQGKYLADFFWNSEMPLRPELKTFFKSHCILKDFIANH